MITFMRRRNLGRASVLGVKASMHRVSNTYKHWKDKTYGPKGAPHMVIRWGCTASFPEWWGTPKVVNRVSAIQTVNDKRGFRALLRDTVVDTIPETIFHVDEAENYPLVVRPSHHAQGKNLWVVNDLQELLNVTSTLPTWYASTLIDKVSEYRVYVVSGRVVTVAKKTPDDPTAVAWNVAQGGRFDVVPWGEWDLNVCRVAIRTFRQSGLDFGGVDVMVDEGGRAYVIEINSAPSLPKLSDGSVSYRQECMAKAFDYIYDNGTDWIEPEGYENWRDVIHPSIWSN